MPGPYVCHACGIALFYWLLPGRQGWFCMNPSCKHQMEL